MGMPVALHKFTVQEFQRMAELGLFREDDRLELIHGQIVEMSPIGPRHAGCVKQLTRIFYRLADDAVILGVQDPVVLALHEAPQPDIAVLRHRPDGYRTRHPDPADILLVVEVADSSVEYDRTTKIPLYAAAGVPEAWLVALPSRTIEVYREPTAAGYADIRTARRGETLRPVLLPEAELSVDEILG